MLPKTIQGDRVVLQLEFDHEMGTTVQCGDLIVQKFRQFVPQACDPKCVNGGVCSNGLCKCSKMYTGEQCEIKRKSSCQHNQVQM